MTTPTRPNNSQEQHSSSAYNNSTHNRLNCFVRSSCCSAIGCVESRKGRRYRNERKDGTVQDRGYFGTESATWTIGSEAVLNLGGARAVLMQLAHPLVAMGVSSHSRYISDPFGRAMSTFMLGQLLAFGSQSTAHQAALTINRLHKHVEGTLPAAAGDHTAGAIYR